MNRRYLEMIVLILIFLGFVWIQIVWSAPTRNRYEVKLFWDASYGPNLAGYTLYWGPEPGKYTSWVTVDMNVLNHTQSLRKGYWCFAVLAFDTAGKKSAFSNEVCLTVPLVP